MTTLPRAGMSAVVAVSIWVLGALALTGAASAGQRGAPAATVHSAAASTAPDLPRSYLFTPSGRLTPLRAHVTFTATQFPIPIRLTPPIPGWSGAQWKSGNEYYRGGKPPNFGWIHLAGGPPNRPSGGLVSIMTAYGNTPSVAATVGALRYRGPGGAYDRTRPRGATYDATSPVRLAGFSGVQFDGQIVGAKDRDHIGHYFIPFSRRTHAAGYYPDEYPVYGDVFRVIVLDVRGKTVVIFIENVALPPDQFPGFLAKAGDILKSLRFPATAG